VPNLQALLQPEARPTTVASRDARPVEASGRPTDTGTLNAGAGNPLAPPAVAAPKEPTEPVAKAPAAPPRPTYKVKPGDTYDGIARAQLGSASLRTEIARLNPGVRPERLQVGTVLVLPAPAELAQAAKPTPGTAPAAVGDARAVVAYTVGRGDTLEGIARRQLGDRKRVDELRELNPDVDPTRLRIGQKIRLPKQ
jgi:nucleoid-associated protein YgaU